MTSLLNFTLKSIVFLVILSIGSVVNTSTVEANTTNFVDAFGGYRFNGISRVGGNCQGDFCDDIIGAPLECAPWDGGSAICRKEMNRSGRPELVYGECTNQAGGNPQYDCTRITNIPDTYTRVGATRSIPNSIINSALGETQSEGEQDLTFQPGYVITVDSKEYSGECSVTLRDGTQRYSCRSSEIEGVLRDCFLGDPKEVTCRSDVVSEDVETVEDLTTAQPVSGQSQSIPELTVGDSKEKTVAYESFTNFPGIGRISNMCQLMESLWFLGFAVLFIGVIGSILYGGFLYTSAGVNAAQVNQAKGVISNAFIGLGLGLSIFVILQTVDPNLLGGNCEVPEIKRLTKETSQ